MILAGVILLAYSCAETKEPTTMEKIPGNWDVASFYVNAQNSGASIFKRFILERDKTFVLEDQNGVFFRGTWTAEAKKLNLKASDATVFDFAIETAQYNKMQLVQKIKNAGTDLEITYLLNRNRNNSLDRY